MPNWCNNSITITGPKATITDLWNRAQKADPNGEFGLLNAMVPMPRELEGTTSPSDTPNWYNWRVNNWGTKWDISDEGLELSEDGTEITGWFDSAWSPPIEAYNTFLTENQECSIRATYEEGGMDFAGIYEDMEDDGMDGISEWCEAVIKGTCALEDTPQLFQTLDQELELVESRAQWFEDEEEVTVQ